MIDMSMKETNERTKCKNNACFVLRMLMSVRVCRLQSKRCKASMYNEQREGEREKIEVDFDLER